MLLLELGCRYQENASDIDFLFNWSFWDTRLQLYHLERNQRKNPRIPITDGGFRGNWENTPKKKGTSRIIVTGAGHTFADNVTYGEAWPEYIEHALTQRGKATDVWNLAVNGSTVVFTHRVLLDKIISAKPDVVILSHSGYNEAIYSDISEQAIVFNTYNWRNAFLASALVRRTIKYTARAWNILSDNPRTHKVSLNTFQQAYDDIITTLNKHGIYTILLQQEVITPDIKPFWLKEDLEMYRTAFKDIAQRHSLPLIDPRDLYANHPQMYFDAQEYYSPLMHQTLSEHILPIIEIAIP